MAFLYCTSLFGCCLSSYLLPQCRNKYIADLLSLQERKMFYLKEGLVYNVWQAGTEHIQKRSAVLMECHLFNLNTRTTLIFTQSWIIAYKVFFFPSKFHAHLIFGVLALCKHTHTRTDSQIPSVANQSPEGLKQPVHAQFKLLQLRELIYPPALCQSKNPVSRHIFI